MWFETSQPQLLDVSFQETIRPLFIGPIIFKFRSLFFGSANGN